MILQQKKQLTFGIDISDRSIEFTEIGSKKNKPAVKLSLIADIPAGIIKKGKIKKQGDFDRVMNDLLDKAEREGFSFENVVMTIPDELVELHLVKLSDEELKENPEAKVLEKLHDILSKKSDKWNYEIFEVAIKNETHFLFVGVEENHLFEQVKNINAFGIDVEAAIPDGFALSNVVDSKNGAIVIDLGASKSFLYFILEGLVLQKENIEWGGESLVEELSKLSKLSPDKEEKFFQRVGYGTRATAEQRKLIEEYFIGLNVEIENFLKTIEVKFGYKPENILFTGGPSRMVGFSKLITKEVKFKLLESDLTEDKHYITSLGAALGLYKGESQINLLNNDLKDRIEYENKMELKAKEEEMIKKETEKGEMSEDVEYLKSVFSQRWGESLNTETWPKKYRLSSKITFVSQILFVVCVALGGISYLLYDNSKKQEEIQIQDNKIEFENNAREFFTFNFPLVVSTGETPLNTESATAIGNFKEYVAEVKQEFNTTNGKVTQEDINNAKSILEERLRKGFDSDKYIKLTDKQFLINEAVVYEESLAASDKPVDFETDKFTYTVKARMVFAVGDKERFDVILNQRMKSRLKKSEQDSTYTVKATEFELIRYDSTTNVANFNVNAEANK